MIALQVENVTRRFPNPDREESEITVLEQISFEILSEKWVTLLGPSGSGKSSLLSILAGLDQPTTGKVTLFGKRLDLMNEEEKTAFRRKNVGFIFQSYHLITSFTAYENVLTPLELLKTKQAKQKAKQWLEKVGLAHRMHHRPHQLSGGEQQRVAIARALVHEPKIIFADEPTGNLDSQNGLQILNLLKSLREQTTLVLVTHDHSIAKGSDQIFYLKDGSLQKGTLNS